MGPLWYKEPPTIHQKLSKSVIHPFTTGGYQGLTINPYQGCQHRCAYCYATYEWSPDFYDRIYAKSNAAEILEGELKKWKGTTIKPVMVSSATDCYQPAEIRFGITRKCIRILQKYGVPYYVFTKSSIIERDLELHRQYRDKCFIVWSVTTCDEAKKRLIEPGTPPASKLFDTIERFSKAGVSCGVNIDPIIPLITDSCPDLDAIIEKCRNAGIKYALGSVMHLRSDIWDRMKMLFQLLELPDAVPKYKEIYGFEEPLSSLYVYPNLRYSEKIMRHLNRRFVDNGILNGFPDFMEEAKLIKSVPGQMTMTEYLC